MKIYRVPHPIDNFKVCWICPRGEKICRDGLLAQENVELVSDPNQADYFFWDYVPQFNGEKSKKIINEYAGDRLVVVDWIDETGPEDYHIDPSQCLLYFKRSWVSPVVGMPHPCPTKLDKGHRFNCHPFAYCALDEFYGNYIPWENRQINVGCYLRWTCPNRNLAIQLTQRALSTRNNIQTWIGEVSSGSRSKHQDIYIDDDYFAALHNTKIVITCNPTWWEGDSRLWEAMAQGCLVFVDKMFTRYKMKLEHEVHIIEYDFNNMDKFDDLLHYYIDHDQEAKQIAYQGYEFVKKYHRPVNRMKEVVNAIEAEEMLK